MKFHSARCDVCSKFIFEPDELFSFAIRNKVIKPVDLHGEEPWAGIYSICLPCVVAIKEFADSMDNDHKEPKP